MTAIHTRNHVLARTFLLGFAAGLLIQGPAPAAESSEFLPVGSAPAPLEAAWFPSRMHAFVWRNWELVPLDRLAAVVGAEESDIAGIGRSMGLEPPRGLSDTQRRRAYLTVIRRNWHLLPYEQILPLLGWTAEQLAYTLREDDFFFIKVGSLKPKCLPLCWAAPTAAETARAGEIATLVREGFPKGALGGKEPLFSFVDALKSPLAPASQAAPVDGNAPLRMGYSYFALCGDPLLDPALDPYPDGLLARLAAVGENAVWLHVELGHLASVPWAQDTRIEQRRSALRDLVARAAKAGMKVFLYFNEPRSLPKASPVFKQHPDWRGTEEKDSNALCTSSPEVRAALREAITDICRAVPELGGFFTVTASENLTSCWSHGQGRGCSRCKDRAPATVIAEVNATLSEGVRAAGGTQRYLACDWGWRDEWALGVIERLPANVELMSGSEWGVAIERGGVKSAVGELSLSAVGPGPRALRHWEAAKKRGLRAVAKIQCGNSWELSAVPYLPVLENVTRHAIALRDAGLKDIMLGWTLGGYPSPNIDAISEISAGGTLETLAIKRHGAMNAPAAATFWRECSAAFREFPFNIGCVYSAPLQMGPANPLWPAPTGYKACMVGIPYDDLQAWRAIYPAEVFISQMEKVAGGFDAAIVKLRSDVAAPPPALAEEIRFAEAAAIHFSSVANQARAVVARDAGDSVSLRRLCEAEATLAIRLHALQSRDSRIGFEASNQYFYIPLDLVEKVINCRWVAARLK